MSFLDQKEQVMEIGLTSWGKRLLAEGKFQPEYYSFHDDDILYDSLFGGLIEGQNDAQIRIRSNTPCLDARLNRQGIETNIRQDQHAINRKERSLPLGTSRLDSQHVPSWSVRVFEGSISSSAQTAPGEILPVQLDMHDVIYYTTIHASGSKQPTENRFLNEGNSFPDGTSIYIQPDFLFVEVDEEHVDDDLVNFEIEMFVVETGSAGETLKPLNFIPKPQLIQDGFLLDESELPQDQQIVAGVADVAYYLDILVDREIEPDVYCRFEIIDRVANIYSQDALSCPEKASVKSFQGLYDSPHRDANRVPKCNN